MSLLPWIQEAQTRNELVIADCLKCKTTVSTEQRQYLGCGYEPAVVAPERLTMWRPATGAKGYHGIGPTMCAGYTTSLPEVREVAAMRMHWDKGNLGCVLGEPAHEFLSTSVLILEGQYNAMQTWRMTPADEGGGGK